MMGGTKNFGKYKIESTIGRGATGVVYRAYDPDMCRSVAIKTLRAELLDGLDHDEKQDLLKRFRSEAKAYGRLLHPNIVTCYSCDEAGDILFIVMEYIDGVSLQHQLSCGTKFTVDKIIEIMEQLLSALDYSHSHRVIHRDIKPANIMFTATGQVKVADFGVAKVDSTHMTRSGYVVGSPEYMSPEQFTGQDVDKRTDIFSAGVIFYQLLTGKKPFTGSDLGAVLHNVLHVVPDVPSSLNSQAPVEIDAVVMKAICKNSEERYQSAREFVDAIKKAIGISGQNENTSEDWEETLVIQSDTTDSSGFPGLPVKNNEINSGINDQHNAKNSAWPFVLKIAASVFVFGFIGLYLMMTWQPESDPISESALPETTLPLIDDALLSSQINAIDVEVIVAAYDCADIDTKIKSDNVTLTGFVASAKDSQELKESINALPGLQEFIYGVEVQEWPYCELLTIVSPFIDRASEEEAVFSKNSVALRFKEGSYLQFDLTAPSFPAYMYVDYFLLDGTVVHLLPNLTDQNNMMEPHKKVRFGDGETKNRQWTITAPFGREMITVIVTRQPLFSGQRPEIENAKEYLSALKYAMLTHDQSTLLASYTYIYTDSAMDAIAHKKSNNNAVSGP